MRPRSRNGTRTRAVSFKLTESDIEAMDAAAEAEEVSLSEWLRRAARERLGRVGR